MSRNLRENKKREVAASQRWCCKHCNDILQATYQIDHIIPHCLSHNDDYENLQALCSNCHSLKTMKESNRIIKFKKLRARENKNICWFCLSVLCEKHICDKQLKMIFLSKPVIGSSISTLDKYYYTEEDIIRKMEDLKIQSTTLKIVISRYILWVNDCFTEISEECTIEDISHCVNICTRTKKDFRKYDEVEVSFRMADEEIPEELITHLDTYLHDAMPKRIFKTGHVKYFYIL
jgi:hypothetical protein